MLLIIIGELLNSTRKEIKEKISSRDVKYIRKIARKQEENGADYIDVNAGDFAKNEKEHLLWMVKNVREAVDCPLSLDSANAEAIKTVLEKYPGEYIINSISAETDKFNDLLSPVLNYKTEVIALCMDDNGIPKQAEKKVTLAQKLTDKLLDKGVAPENIYLDPLVQPVSVQPDSAKEVIKAISLIDQWDLNINIVCGLSNISYGLPERKYLNQAFLIMCLEHGLNSVIANPLDDYLLNLLKASDVILNKDSYGMNYIKAARAGKLS